MGAGRGVVLPATQDSLALAVGAIVVQTRAAKRPQRGPLAAARLSCITSKTVRKDATPWPGSTGVPDEPLLRGSGDSAPGLLQDGVEHLHDELLLGARELLDALDLLLKLRRGTALGGARAVLADQVFEGDGERGGDLREQ